MKIFLFLFVVLCIFPLTSHAYCENGYLYPKDNRIRICSDDQIMDPGKVIQILDGVEMLGTPVHIAGTTGTTDDTCSIKMSVGQDSNLSISFNININGKNQVFREVLNPEDLLFVKRDTEDFSFRVTGSYDLIPKGPDQYNLLPYPSGFFLSFKDNRVSLLSERDKLTALVCYVNSGLFQLPTRDQYSY